MRSTYGVVWREGEGPLSRGKLELLPESLRLDGVAASAPLSREVSYDQLAEVRVGRAAGERIGGRPSLVLEPRAGGTISIASIAEAGVIGELAERIAVLRAGRRVVVVLPLREGSAEAVRLLLADGPPFDPDALGLERHTVYLTGEEVVFVFEWRGETAFESLLAQPGLWDVAAAWTGLAAGPPRPAGPAYTWTRPDEAPLDEALLPPGLHAG